VPPYVEVPLRNGAGEYILDYVLGQDMVAWYGQGEITDRSEERLGASDACIVAYRKLLKEQIEKVAQGKDPMNVFRDPEKNVRLEPPVPSLRELRGGHVTSSQQYRAQYHKAGGGDRAYIEDDVDRYCPDKELLLELYRQVEKATCAGGERQPRKKMRRIATCSPKNRTIS
jgi:5,5'-dehydrodivanillate O-demethylase